MRLLYLFLAGLLFSSVLRAQAPAGIQLSDMLKIKTPGAPQLSPDGRRVYFLLNSITADADKKWEYNYSSQLWMAATDGALPPRPLTSGKESVSQPALSPDGSRIVFVRAVDGKPQIFLLPLDGGEAGQLTHEKYGASSPVWSPDGNTIAFLVSIPWRDFANDSTVNPSLGLPTWPAERPGQNNGFLQNSKAAPDPDGSIEEARAWLQLNEKDKKAKLINRLSFQEESTTNGDLSITHIYTIAATPGSPSRAITRGFNSYGNPQFLSNQALLVSGEADLLQHPDRNLAPGIYLVRTDSNALPRPWLVKKDYSYQVAAISKTGKWVAIQHGPAGFLNIPTLAVVAGKPTAGSLTDIPLDRSKSGLHWKGDEQLYGCFQSNGGSQVFRYEPASRKMQTWGNPDEGINALDITANTLVYTKTAIADPAALYVADASGNKEKQLSHFNSDWLAAKQLSLPEKHRFTNEKGLTIEYWIMKPIGWRVGKKYPLLLQIHGGPSAMWGPGESSMWHEFQYWCSKGYGVVYSNPRGSGGYGIDFLKANQGDWGRGPMDDVLKALDLAVAEGWADTSRLFLTGGSYAGYLGAYILGHDQRFRAACSQRGVYDLRTFFGEGNAWRLVPYYFGGYPWEPAVDSLLNKESPITYVQNIRTPYIIFHGENDLRTGVIQGEQLYKSLKVLGRPVEYVRHPGATHEITRSGNNRQRMDQLLRTWEFFERYRVE